MCSIKKAVLKNFTILKKNTCVVIIYFDYLLSNHSQEVVYVTIGNPAFCLASYLTGAHFQGELQHIGHVGEREIAGVRF